MDKTRALKLDSYIEVTTDIVEYNTTPYTEVTTDIVVTTEAASIIDQTGIVIP
jgi:hypothetical protein